MKLLYIWITWFLNYREVRQLKDNVSNYYCMSQLDAVVQTVQDKLKPPISIVFHWRDVKTSSFMSLSIIMRGQINATKGYICTLERIIMMLCQPKVAQNL